MEKFEKIKSKAILIETDNIDTDQIIPARFLKTTEKTGLGKAMFYNWRHDEKGRPNEDVFPQKNPGIRILVSGKSFGTGSSREHAVWALMDYGFRAIISSEFGDIFYNNSLKNGLLCVKLTDSQLEELFAILKSETATGFEIDLEGQAVRISGTNKKFGFEIDPFRKKCLILGVDELGYIMSHLQEISAYEKSL